MLPQSLATQLNVALVILGGTEIFSAWGWFMNIERYLVSIYTYKSAQTLEHKWTLYIWNLKSKEHICMSQPWGWPLFACVFCKFWLWKRTVCSVSTGQARVSHSRVEVATRQQLMLKMHLLTPPIIHTHTQSQLPPASDWWSWKSKNASVSLLFACGLQYGLAGLSSCPEEVGVRWQPSGASPFPPLPYGHTQTLRHSCRFPDNHHPAGQWVEEMWPVEMRHNAGLSQIFCLSASLKITSLEGLTETEMKEFCFPLWLQRSPSALSSPQLLDAVALLRCTLASLVLQKSEHFSTPSFVLRALSSSQMNIAFLIVLRI